VDRGFSKRGIIIGKKGRIKKEWSDNAIRGEEYTTRKSVVGTRLEDKSRLYRVRGTEEEAEGRGEG
jgi:hypothetical protein